MTLVRCKDCKYAQILKTIKMCRVFVKPVEVLVPRECKDFEVRE